MMVDIDPHSGFCFGVTSAIEKAQEELHNGPLFCLGDIVHNEQEVKRLENLGLETIDYDDLRTIHQVRVLLRAHGEPPTTYSIARANNNEIIDATCPVVKRLQERIRTTYLNHPEALIVIFGKLGHAEVIGLQGQTNNNAFIIEKTEDVENIPLTKDIYLFSQTTKSIEQFRELTSRIQTRIQSLPSHSFRPALYVNDTICRNVANRVQHIQEFARSHDYIIFVGGEKSSNAKVLFARAKEANPHSLFVSSPQQIAPLFLQENITPTPSSVGICGATSTPLWLMQECKQEVENFFAS